MQIALPAARQWLNTPMVEAAPQPGPTAERSGGVITPVPVPAAALPTPAGIIATRCLRCGSTRLHYPGVGFDPWRGHPDQCLPRSAAALLRGARERPPRAGGSPPW